jgi:hypothetical protein
MKKGVTRRKVLSYIRKNPKAKAREVANALGIGIASVYNVTYQARKAQKQSEQNAPALKLSPKLASKPIRIELIKPQDKKAIAEVLHTITQGRGKEQPRLRMQSADNVNHPPHYKVGGIEVIDFIESKGLTYNLGNVVKYVSRADHKGNKLEDLKKAQWYLNREVSNLEKSK